MISYFCAGVHLLDASISSNPPKIGPVLEHCMSFAVFPTANLRQGYLNSSKSKNRKKLRQETMDPLSLPSRDPGWIIPQGPCASDAIKGWYHQPVSSYASEDIPCGLYQPSPVLRVCRRNLSNIWHYVALFSPFYRGTCSGYYAFPTYLYLCSRLRNGGL